MAWLIFPRGAARGHGARAPLAAHGPGPTGALEAAGAPRRPGLPRSHRALRAPSRRFPEMVTRRSRGHLHAPHDETRILVAGAAHGRAHRRHDSAAPPRVSREDCVSASVCTPHAEEAGCAASSPSLPPLQFTAADCARAAGTVIRVTTSATRAGRACGGGGGGRLRAFIVYCCGALSSLGASAARAPPPP